MKILKVLIILFIIIFLIAVAFSIYDPDCFHDIAKAIRLKFFHQIFLIIIQLFKF